MGGALLETSFLPAPSLRQGDPSRLALPRAAPAGRAAPPLRGERATVRTRAQAQAQALEQAALPGLGGTFVLFGAGQRAAEKRLLGALGDISGRGRGATRDQLQEVADAVEELEVLRGVANPVYSRQIEGSWKLLFTTRPGTASPIQRTFVGVDAFSVFQQIQLSTWAEQGEETPRVSNIVVFGDNIGRLKVEAKGGAASGQRINFCFDRAAFELKFWPYRVPYPVPFRLLGDEAKGWLDTTYLSPSGMLRISRGNKGTTFVLQKFFTPQELLLAAIRRRQGVAQAIEEVIKQNPTRHPGRSALNNGPWRLLWTQPADTASKIETFSTGLGLNYQVFDLVNDRLDTVVQFLPGVVLRAGASLEVISNSVFDVEIDSAELSLGPVSVPLGIRGTGTIDVLYVDESLRISRGNKGSLYVQQRERNPPSWL